MKILVKYSNYLLDEQVKEQIIESGNKIFFANTTEKAIRILDDYNIDEVFIEINSLEQVNFVEFVNKYYPQIKVFITTDDYNESILKTIKKGLFSVLKEPLTLQTIISKT